MSRWSLTLPLHTARYVRLFSTLLLLGTSACVLAQDARQPTETPATSSQHTAAFRGPVDLVLLDAQRLVATANELTGTISLIDLGQQTLLDEITVGGHPVDIARVDDHTLAVTCRDSGELVLLRVSEDRLTRLAAINVGYLPSGIAITASGKRAFVSRIATGDIVEVDLETHAILQTIPVGKWPRFIALTADDTRLVVGVAGESRIAVHDAKTGEELVDTWLSGGINLGRMQLATTGNYVYFPWMLYSSNPINRSNIQRGWVLASRIGRVNILEEEIRQAISLDVPGEAVADPHAVAVTPDQSTMICTSSGTHEVLVYRLTDMPFIGAGGPGDLIDRRLQYDSDRFYRIETGGRPMGAVTLDDNRRVVLVNHTRGSVQVVDLKSRKVTREISLGPQPSGAQALLVHRGREIFHDAGRSLDQWYSCASCHAEGGTNAKPMDTLNDGSNLTSKTVLPLYGVQDSGPWTWHGWQTDLDASFQKSFVSTMLGKPASDEDIQALRAYLGQLRRPPNPFSESEKHAEVASRGRTLFHSAGCADCHSGHQFSDGQIHDVGLAARTDKYDGYNTPSLLGVYLKPRLLHDGRSKSLSSVLHKWHRPQDLGNGLELSEDQLDDLIAYLRTL